MAFITISVKPDDRAKIREMTEFDGLNLSAFVRAKIRERYKDYKRGRSRQ